MNQNVEANDDPSESAIVDASSTDGVEDLATLLENEPDSAAEKILQLMHSSEDIPSLLETEETDEDEEEQAELQEYVAQALAVQSLPAATSLGELRAQARLTVNDVAEKLDLPAETIDYMEEDIPIIDMPRSLLRVLGDLYGFSAAQIETVLRFQGNQRAVPVAYKLRRGKVRQGGLIAPPSTARSFTQVLMDTGATEEQVQHWLLSDSDHSGENADITGLIGDLFA